MLIKRDVFPDLVTAKYKTLGDEKFYLNNLHKKILYGRGENNKDS